MAAESAASRTLRVLHVVESYGAGTATALDQYVRATPELEHHLIRRYRPDDDHADDGEQRRFASVSDLAPGLLPAVRSVRRRVRELGPDVVHGHSSFGGAFARLGTPRGGALRVYTPHCFATERRDISGVARVGYATAERVLGRRTDVVAGCSAREVQLARRFAPKARHLFVPNVSGVAARTSEPHNSPPVLVTAGRVTAQRDPDLLLAVLAELRRLGVDVRARWVGGGDPASIARLEAAGVEVTGWVPRSDGLAQVAAADVYVHTAAWDGTPMTLVEAVSLGVPTVARRTPAVTEPAAYTPADAAGLADAVRALLADHGAMRRNREAWSRHFADHTTAAQRAALLTAYGAAA